eukprot:10727831-Ditylum_brightwellii.AAC.1
MAVSSLLVSYCMLVFLPHRTAARLFKEEHKRGNKMPSKKKTSESGWDKVHGMHIKLYGANNRTVDYLRHCFTNTHQTKAPFGDPAITQEIREAKMAWMQICAKSECSTGSSKESASESKDKKDDVELQELLAPQMAQTIPSLSGKKKVIELGEDKSSKSESNLSTFEAKPFKWLKKESVAKPSAKKSSKAVADKTELLSVALSVSTSKRK